MKKRMMKKAVKTKVRLLMKTFSESFSGRTANPIRMPIVKYANLSNEPGICMYGFTPSGVVGGIVLNGPAMKANWSKFMTNVIHHEVSHWCHALLFGESLNDGNREHGPSFNTLMTLLGADPGVGVAPFIAARVDGVRRYRCACSEINELDGMGDGSHYECSHCGQELKIMN